MSFEDSEDSDSDYNELEVPLSPPKRPTSLLVFFIEQNRNLGMNENALRVHWKEGIGQKERQKWKKKHKKICKKYERLVQLYSDHHPEYDFNAEYSNNQNRQKSRKNRKLTSNSNRNNNNSSNTNRKKRGHQSSNYMIDSSMAEPSRKKQKTSNNNNNNNNNNNHNNNNNPYIQDDSANLSTIFKTNPKRKRVDPDDFKPSEDQLIQMKNLVNSMRNAARKDWQNVIAKKPAINTTKMLPIVINDLSKKLFHKHYLDQTDILEALRDWIHPLPDGSLPSLKMRTEMYHIIEKFALFEYESGSLEEFLLKSDDKAKDPQFKSDVHPNLKAFAKTVINLWAHKEESVKNKTLLRKIIDKWIRTLTNSDSTWGDKRDEDRENSKLIKNRHSTLAKQTRNYSHLGKSNRAKIPEAPWHDFAEAPQSILSDDKRKQISHMNKNNNPFNERINKTFKKVKTSKQAAKPSVTGRDSRK